MSWGEETCAWYGIEKQPCKPTMGTCNTNCGAYVPKEVTVTRVFPAWLRRMLMCLDIEPTEAQKRYNDVHYETIMLVNTLEKLYERNLLMLELQNGPFEEKDKLFVRGIPFTVQYVQNRRLVLELPAGRRFVKKDKWR